MKDVHNQIFFLCPFSCSSLRCSAVVLTSFAYVCREIHLLSAFVLYDIDMLFKRVNSADNFCYMCGEITFASQKRALTVVVK